MVKIFWNYGRIGGTEATALEKDNSFAEDGEMKKALVAIGVNKTGGLPPLRAAVDSAKKISEWAGSQGFMTILHTDDTKPVTLAEITTSIKSLVEMRCFEMLVVYFSGHGFLKGSNYEIWLLSGAPADTNEAVNVTGSIALSRNCGIPHVVFISDACRSLPVTQIMGYVDGGKIFPGQQPHPPMPEVDTFYATSPGDASYEVASDTSTANYRGLFTECLLPGLRGHIKEVIHEIVEEGLPKYVVPSRSLKIYLKEAVPNAANAVSIALKQEPEIRVESELPRYLSEIAMKASTTRSAPPIYATGERIFPPEDTPPHKGLPLSLPASQKLSNSDVLEYLKQGYFEGDQSPLMQQILDATASHPVASEIQELLAAKGRISFETHTGFTVSGAKVVSALATDLSCGVFEENGLSQVRIAIDPNSITGFAYESRSVVMRFDTGTGACLAVLPGFVGSVVVSKEGRINSVNYTPSANSGDLYSEYLCDAEKLEQRRSFAAVASRLGSFHLGKKDSLDAARYLRMLKSIDPSLGIYAAYAYAQAGNYSGIQSVFRYMSEKIYDYHTPIPFDVAMLAHQDGPWPEAKHFPPVLPMLTQGWALLGGWEHSIPKAILSARHHLLPSLWTTFTEEGIEILENAIREGEFPWI